MHSDNYWAKLPHGTMLCVLSYLVYITITTVTYQLPNNSVRDWEVLLASFFLMSSCRNWLHRRRNISYSDLTVAMPGSLAE